MIPTTLYDDIDSTTTIKCFNCHTTHDLMSDQDVYVCQYCAENSTITTSGSVLWCVPPTYTLHLHDLQLGQFYMGILRPFISKYTHYKRTGYA